MKHAYLIVAHNNWNQLKNLIRLLDKEYNDIYIHVDLKAKDFPEDEIKNSTVHSKIFIFRKFKVYWGTFTQIQTEMLLFEEAYKWRYDYYHMISNADLPLKSQKEIYEFFENNKGKEFIHFVENYDNNAIENRIKLYHPLQKYIRYHGNVLFSKIMKVFEKILLSVQKMLHVNRLKNNKWRIYYGSNWVIISHELVGKIVEYKDKINQMFQCSSCADELLVQTVAMNCGFEDRIYQPSDNVIAANLYYIDWERGENGGPYTFRSVDYNNIMTSGALFARKFSESIDSEIIERITKEVKKI